MFSIFLLFIPLLNAIVPEVRQTFVIVFVRSSGSTVLCSYLNHQPKVLCHDEYIVDYSAIESIVKVPLSKTKTALSNSGFNKESIDDWNVNFGVEKKCSQKATNSSSILNECKTKRTNQSKHIFVYKKSYCYAFKTFKKI